MTRTTADAPPNSAIDVIVVAYGASELLERCLAGLEGCYHVTVVDNSSSETTRSVAETTGASYLDPGTNLGFAAGVNLALAQRRVDRDVLLLNPDAVVTPAAIELLHRTLASEPQLACVAPRQHHPESRRDDKVMWPFPSPSRAWLEAFGLARFLPSDGFVIGSVMLLRSRAIADVGLLDERFFLYAEESDWQRRAVNRGWSVRIVDDAEAEHLGAATSSDETLRELRFAAAQERYVRKWHGTRGWETYRAATVLGALGRSLAPGRTDRASDRRRARAYTRGPLRALEDHLRAPAIRTTSAKAERSAQNRRLQVVHVVCTDAFAGVERYVTTLAGALSYLGCDVTVLGGDQDQMHRWLGHSEVRFGPAPTISHAVARLYALGHVDIVHAHMFDAELAAALARPSSRAPIVSTRHFAARRGSSAPARLFGRALSRVPRAQLAISQYVADSIEGASVIVAPGVADVEDSTPATDRRREVLLVQRLEPEKRTEVGIQAFARSGLGSHGWELVIAGGGAERDRLRATAESLGVGQWCRFLGPQRDVDSLYRSAGIFLATRPDEPFGISVVEAMAHGMPVVAARGGGHLETVGRCEEALLFAPGNISEAATLLQGLAEDPDRRRRYGGRLQVLQRARFTVESQANATLALYRSIIEAREDGKDRITN